jgi:hypothetical protein
MERINFPVRSLISDVELFAPGWTAADCQDNPYLGLKSELFGRQNVLFTHPASRDVPCRLLTHVTLSDRSPALHLVVGHFPDGDWRLVARVNGDVLLDQVVGEDTATDGWLELNIDLSTYAGEEVSLELLNQASGWGWEGGYWELIELVDAP